MFNDRISSSLWLSLYRVQNKFQREGYVEIYGNLKHTGNNFDFDCCQRVKKSEQLRFVSEKDDFKKYQGLR